MKIGRYEIKFSRYLCIPTHVPTIARRFLFFIWVSYEARGVSPQNVDKKMKFPLGTHLEYAGRRYHYCKAKTTEEFVECTDENPCCDRRGEYNGFASGPPLFECPKHCRCHD